MDEEFIVSICYEAEEEQEELNAKIDFLAGLSEGVFVSSKVEDCDIVRSYKFNNCEDSENFVDAANVAISAMQEVVIVKESEINENLRWKSGEAIYHHIGFDKAEDSLRFYRLMRANFASYLSPDMYDMFVAELDAGDLYVFIGFPVESAFVIDENLDEDEDEGDLFDFAGPKVNKKTQLN